MGLQLQLRQSRCLQLGFGRAVETDRELVAARRAAGCQFTGDWAASDVSGQV